MIVGTAEFLQGKENTLAILVLNPLKLSGVLEYIQFCHLEFKK